MAGGLFKPGDMALVERNSRNCSGNYLKNLSITLNRSLIITNNLLFHFMASGYNNDLLHGSGIMELIRMHLIASRPS